MFAVSGFGLGALVQTTAVDLSYVATFLLAATVEPSKTGLLLIAVVLLKPTWLQERWRWAWRMLYILVALPIVLTVMDVALGTSLWFSPLSASVYSGGYVSGSVYTTGVIADVLHPFYAYIFPLLSLIPLFYLSWRDRTITDLTRHLARLLWGAQVAAISLQLGLRSVLSVELATLVTTAFFAGLYTLQSNVQALASHTEVWVDMNLRLLQQLAHQPQIVSMNVTEQTPVLQALAFAHPQIYFATTINLEGETVARSDALSFADYAEQEWFKQVKQNAEVTYQVMSRQDGTPALVFALPIIDASGGMLGVTMFESALPTWGDILNRPEPGDTVAYIVDTHDKLIVRTPSAYKENRRDFSNYAPVVALRQETFTGVFEFTDDNTHDWKVYGVVLDNQWAVFVQLSADTYFAQIRRLVQVTLGTLGLGTVLLGMLMFLTMQQSFQPLYALIQVASAIVAGDFSRRVPVQSDDELGILARTFNDMALQLREALGFLERRVQERTEDLAQRSAYLEASAEIAQAIASILDTEDLMQRVVDLICERFDKYYVGLFLIDGLEEWAMLRAGTGTVGQQLLARNYRVHIGEGPVGWCVSNMQARVASRSDIDMIHASIGELSATAAAAALPLISRNRVLGVLDVHSRSLKAFDADILTVLQTMADQIAVALDNARLFAEAQEALEAERRAYGTRARESWFDLTRSRDDWGYRCMQRRAAEPVLTPAVGDWPADMRDAHHSGKNVLGTYVDSSVLAIPIKTSDAVVGVLRFERSEEDAVWSSEEVSLLEALTEQLAQTLERAQLYQETQRRALREQLAREVTDKMRRTLSWDELMQVAIQEMGTALHASRSFVQWVPSAQSLGADDAGGGNG